ncbi:quinone oxidoreductase family protein [Solimonas variicoloris]|uniref:quinone oxidoreductase family protein n=1 Tax=Solimonas variicoloris TaxID=254408 RepID=UPI00036409BC|nr:quinone oxidoreductase [Solimonas variicoloris]
MKPTTRAIRIHAHGGPDALQWDTLELAPPGPGEVLIRHEAIGLNYIDTYHRSGLYPVALPSALGTEGAGRIVAVGAGVQGFAIGDRVAYGGTGPLGAYAEQRLFPAACLVRLPDDIDMRTAAAMMLQGMTAEYLLRRLYPVQRGQTVLLHAAAGGVGLIATQWLKHLGATVIGTVGSEEKAQLARAHGCDHVIHYRDEDVAARVRELTGGHGVPVVYDGVGRDTFAASLDSLAPRGMLVSFGNASGAVEPVSPGLLASKGSLFLTRPRLVDYIATPAELAACANALFDVVRRGAVRIAIGQTYALRDAAQAHRDLEARRTHGSTVLLP